MRRYSELCAFFQSTLLYVQRDHAHLDKCCQDSVGRLVSMGYVTMETGDDPTDSTYMITSLGRAAFKGIDMWFYKYEIAHALLDIVDKAYLYTHIPTHGRHSHTHTHTHTHTTGCLPIGQAHQIYSELMKGQQRLILSTELHLLFLATPTDLCTSIRPNWMVYFEVVRELYI